MALLFLCVVLLALMLLTAALVIWLAEAVASLLGALLLVAGLYGVVAVAIYRLSLRAAVEQLRSRMATIYEVSALLSTLYRQVLSIVRTILGG